MNIERIEDTVVFRELDDFLAELLRQLPESAIPGDAASRGRIFGTLTGGQDREADADWREYVEPELRALFQTHNDVVSGDLKHFTGTDEHQELTLPIAHLPAWIHTLNQARLAIAARHNFTQDDVEGERPPANTQARMALFQIEIYAIILGFLLRHTEL